MKSNTAKKINNDTITVRTKSKKYENEIYVNFKGKAKNTKIIKAQFYFKNKITGKIITKTDFTEFDNGRLELPDEDYSKKICTYQSQSLVY